MLFFWGLYNLRYQFLGPPMNTDCTHLTQVRDGPRVAPCPSPGAGGCIRPEIPYTHSDHARRCREAAQSLVVLRQFVQVHVSFTSCCARIVAAWDTQDGKPMWQLDLLGPIKGRMSVPANKVRQCSGLDSGCSCAGEKPASSGQAKRAGDAGFSASGGVTCL